jgi:hypothetical protein
MKKTLSMLQAKVLPVKITRSVTAHTCSKSTASLASTYLVVFGQDTDCRRVQYQRCRNLNMSYKLSLFPIPVWWL